MAIIHHFAYHDAQEVFHNYSLKVKDGLILDMVSVSHKIRVTKLRWLSSSSDNLQVANRSSCKRRKTGTK
ncbi:hypothetical protein CY34DRAFT_807304 [Suillus luteus UH-Slu-Lm8-n1]|uniref:Uncharacterized protein n=1 Tax=Suillus luteus UH-Slu-Lm8-n1 TaxID=930992 RepID=A0A0D0AF92_9AGAM|nr:hypothetical protein CY34DRAFT_807304 [Suillus luteus UH-Slu-Lm8-n1]